MILSVLVFGAGVYSCVGSAWRSSAVQSQQAHSGPAGFFHWREFTHLHGEWLTTACFTATQCEILPM